MLLLAHGAPVAAHQTWGPLHDECWDQDSPATPYVYVAGPPAGWHVAAGGGLSCHMWTYSTVSNLYNHIFWYLPISSNNDGFYQQTTCLCGANFTANARYERFCCGTGAGVTSVHTINQALYTGWREVTRQTWNGSQGGSTRTGDVTGVGNTKVGMDQIYWNALH